MDNGTNNVCMSVNRLLAVRRWQIKCVGVGGGGGVQLSEEFEVVRDVSGKGLMHAQTKLRS